MTRRRPSACAGGQALDVAASRAVAAVHTEREREAVGHRGKRDDVFEKIGTMRESWRIERVPTQATRRTTVRCPSCEAPLVEPATTFFANQPALITRSTDHLCIDCDARYVLDERVSATWRKADDGSPIASPLRYRRSR